MFVGPLATAGGWLVLCIICFPLTPVHVWLITLPGRQVCFARSPAGGNLALDVARAARKTLGPDNLRFAVGNSYKHTRPPVHPSARPPARPPACPLARTHAHARTCLFAAQHDLAAPSHRSRTRRHYYRILIIHKQKPSLDTPYPLRPDKSRPPCHLSVLAINNSFISLRRPGRLSDSRT